MIHILLQIFFFFLLTGSFGLFLNNVKAANNKDSGVLLSNIRMPVSVTKVTASNNTDGLKFESMSSIAHLKEIEANNNVKNGIFLENSEGFITVEKARISGNLNGLTHTHKRGCNAFSVAHRFALMLQISRSTFRNNIEDSINVVSQCRCNMTVVDTDIINQAVSELAVG